MYKICEKENQELYILNENRKNPEPRLKNHREHALQITSGWAGGE
jgi:hypothetical protein